MEHIHDPFELRDEFVGATLVVARVEHAGCLDNGTGQARPLRPLFPARRCSAPGATLVVVRAGTCRCLGTGTGQARPLRWAISGPVRGSRVDQANPSCSKNATINSVHSVGFSSCRKWPAPGTKS